MTNQFCDCSEDGWCHRYQREQVGRLREVCAGVNVDLGTAAAFREQWMREAGVGAPSASQCDSVVTPRPLLLKTDQAPGDAVAMTAAIYSLHKAHPGKYITSVESYWPEVFAHNPDVGYNTLPGDPASEIMGLPVQMHYPAIHQSNERGIHFMQAWCEFLGSALGIHIPLLTNRPHIYFDYTLAPCGHPYHAVNDYWLVCSGGKRDFTTKLWGHHNYQEVIHSLKGRVGFIQVGGSRPPVAWRADTNGSQEDDHPRLDGTIDMVGKTSLRELFDLCRRARGVLCGVSLLMHVAAALGKPAVVIAGGREPAQWNAYPLQQYLHTVGSLPCSTAQGVIGGACWRYRTVPLGDGTVMDRDTCQFPVEGIPACMRLITPAHVADLILRYDAGVG